MYMLKTRSNEDPVRVMERIHQTVHEWKMPIYHWDKEEPEKNAEIFKTELYVCMRVWGLPGVLQVNSYLASVKFKPSSIYKHIIPADITCACMCAHHFTLFLWNHYTYFQPHLKSAAKCDLMCILKWKMIGIGLLPVLPITHLSFYTLTLNDIVKSVFQFQATELSLHKEYN